MFSWQHRATQTSDFIRAKDNGMCVRNFLNDPNDESSAQVRHWAARVIREEIDRVFPGESPPEAVTLANRVETHIDRRLSAYVAGQTADTANLTEGFACWTRHEGGPGRPESFEIYVRALTLFYLVRELPRDVSLDYDIPRQLIYMCIPFLKHWIEKHRRRRLPGAHSDVQETTLDRLLNSRSLDYLFDPDLQTFQRMVIGLRRRCWWRLRDAQKRRARIENVKEIEELEDKVEVQHGLLLDAAYPIACEAASRFRNDDGRRLFLWLVLGGLSHTRVNVLRHQDERTRYLVQRDLIDTLAELGAIDRVFAQPVHTLMEQLDFYDRVVTARDDAIPVFPDWLENDPNDWILEDNRYGWKMFQSLSDHVAEMIKTDLLDPGEDIADQDDWAHSMQEILADPIQHTPYILAGLTKAVCRQARSWAQRLDQFAQPAH